jgi:hypothetical protein
MMSAAVGLMSAAVGLVAALVELDVVSAAAMSASGLGGGGTGQRARRQRERDEGGEQRGPACEVDFPYTHGFVLLFLPRRFPGRGD